MKSFSCLGTNETSYEASAEAINITKFFFPEQWASKPQKYTLQLPVHSDAHVFVHLLWFTSLLCSFHFAESSSRFSRGGPSDDAWFLSRRGDVRRKWRREIPRTKEGVWSLTFCCALLCRGFYEEFASAKQLANYNESLMCFWGSALLQSAQRVEILKIRICFNT